MRMVNGGEEGMVLLESRREKCKQLELKICVAAVLYVRCDTLIRSNDNNQDHNTVQES